MSPARVISAPAAGWDRVEPAPPIGTGAKAWGAEAATRGERKDDPMVESTLNYLADMPEKPFFYLYDPPPGTPRRNTTADRRSVAIRDARELVPGASLDEAGFLLASHETSVENLYDANAVRDRYYR